MWERYWYKLSEGIVKVAAGIGKVSLGANTVSVRQRKCIDI